MKWQRITKISATFPQSGCYRDWKDLLSTEGAHQCVYCCIHESQFGGIRNFHVEHYRPKSIHPALTDSYENLYFACGVCNILKGDDWPSEPSDDYSDIFYPEPSRVDYSDLLTIDPKTAEVSGHSVTAKYLINRLHLNRPQVLRKRKILLLAAELEKIQNDLVTLLDDKKPAVELVQLGKCISEIGLFFRSMAMAVPYTRADTR